MSDRWCPPSSVPIDSIGGVEVSDVVNSPPHYRGAGGIEAIDVIEKFQLGYHLGNAVKYILRAGRKGPKLEDLRKAIWYLQREIENAERDAGNDKLKAPVQQCQEER